ncbi:hypothetical protein Bca52824_080721 [Brassica carinata]|uniref:Uncharacterized protein n=1 Tax=Brassica carinata TaxID=52824 RepID=A0A8X7PG09_BRACI|nr:hypothetical protein Bca52824_080721 [Brassica carinata]
MKSRTYERRNAHGRHRRDTGRKKWNIYMGAGPTTMAWEDVEVEEDPSEDSEWEEEPASSTGSGRAAGSKPEGEQKSPVRSG